MPPTSSLLLSLVHPSCGLLVTECTTSCGFLVAEHKIGVADEAQADVGAASTQFYTDQVAKESYQLMPDVLAAKVKDPDLRKLMMTLFDAFATISGALREELVVKADEQKSVFGDVQLSVDVVADDLMWDVCRQEPLIK